MSTMGIVVVLPGIFYRSPTPDQPEFKKPGDAVNVGDTIGLVEVMKTFTPVEAGTSGTFVQYLVDNEDAVIPGQAVCEVET